MRRMRSIAGLSPPCRAAGGGRWRVARHSSGAAVRATRAARRGRSPPGRCTPNAAWRPPAIMSPTAYTLAVCGALAEDREAVLGIIAGDDSGQHQRDAGGGGVRGILPGVTGALPNEVRIGDRGEVQPVRVRGRLARRAAAFGAAAGEIGDDQGRLHEQRQRREPRWRCAALRASSSARQRSCAGRPSSQEAAFMGKAA